MLEDLFEHNVQWANAKRREDPEYFNRLAALQSPEYLWIGCSDSRVPANVITGLEPGEVFVHLRSSTSSSVATMVAAAFEPRWTDPATGSLITGFSRCVMLPTSTPGISRQSRIRKSGKTCYAN